MMNVTFAQLFAVFLATAACAASPGPCLLLVASRAASRGVGAGMRVTLGLLMAKALLLVAAWAGLLSLLAADASLMRGLQLVGTALLGALAVAMMTGPYVVSAGPRPGVAGDVVAGLGLGLTNPAGLLFVLALLPGLVDASAGPEQLAPVAAAILVATALPMAAAALLAARRLRAGAGAARWLRTAGGPALLLLALVVALSPPPG
jgi:threonine/homoserine/homoserine lactone efflux protein